MARGKLIDIEGGDGSGKATQVQRLIEALSLEGKLVETMAFPRYDHWSSSNVRKYLAGEFGSSVGPYQASEYYAFDRRIHAPEIKSWLDDGNIVILDRYVGSNKGHQAGKILDREKIDRYLKWVDDFEYGINKIPKPDVTILLHVPFQVSMELAKNRPSKHGSKKDIHEQDPKHLQAAEQAYLYVANKEGWKIVECSDGKNMRSIDDIHKEVYSIVKKII